MSNSRPLFILIRSFAYLCLVGGAAVLVMSGHQTDTRIHQLRFDLDEQHRQRTFLRELSADVRLQHTRWADLQDHLEFLRRTYRSPVEKFNHPLETAILNAYKLSLVNLVCGIEAGSGNEKFCQDFSQNFRSVNQYTPVRANHKKYEIKYQQLQSQSVIEEQQLRAKIIGLVNQRQDRFMMCLLAQIMGMVLLFVSDIVSIKTSSIQKERSV